MTEKVVIPQNVADAIERFRNAEYSDYGIVSLLGKSEATNPNLIEYEVILDGWIYEDDGANADKLLNALLIGYEIEPEPLKVGDWAKHTTQDGREFIGKIHEIKNGNRAWGHWNESKTYGFIYLDELVKMTPEEIEHRKWAEIELGDVLIHKAWGYIAILMELNGDSVKVNAGNGNLAVAWWKRTNCELYAKKVSKDV